MRRQIDLQEKRARVASAGLAIVGKQGAQRRIAEDALREIEARACDLWRGARWTCRPDRLVARGHRVGGVVLVLRGVVPDERARQAMREVRARARSHLVNKLEIVPSDVSGAAEDLAGAAVQLAASAWLRENR